MTQDEFDLFLALAVVELYGVFRDERGEEVTDEAELSHAREIQFQGIKRMLGRAKVEYRDALSLLAEHEP